jgi:malate dehydrogenase (oxaloacetate-decarboxylating)
MAPRSEDLLAKAQKPAADALRLHPFYRGKIQMMPKCPVRDDSDFAIWYTPGVAAPCRAIHDAPDLVYAHTNKANTIAVLSDGSRVLGLGDIGPEAGLPVMEGKALLFKILGGVDAVPLCIRAHAPEDIVRAARLIEPSFGAINLEDIAQPQCFRVLDAAREALAIPVWHDDQQGTATVLLAGLLNALEVVGKELGKIRVVMIGMGAANVAVYRLLTAVGLDPGAIVACDSVAVLHRGRRDIAAQQEEFVEKWRVCTESNADNLRGGAEGAFRGADVCIAFSRSGPGIVRPEWVETMAEDAVVFACANPVPEIWPWQARDAGARIVATGRSDFPNQVNNALGFPGIFRGVLDVRARTISDEMAQAAARALAAHAVARGLSEAHILPAMGDSEVAARIAAATGIKAQEQGLAALSFTEDELYEAARARIRQARQSLELLTREGLIPAAPSGRA